jgi:zinc transporter, ZIP family
MSRRFWAVALVSVLVIAFVGGFAATRGISGNSSGGEVTVDHATLFPGRIVLTLESDSDEAVTIAQTIVNDAFVDFEPGRPGAADVVIEYPWIEGESYEIVLLTPTGESIDYELENATEA